MGNPGAVKKTTGSSTIQKALDVLKLFRHKHEWSFAEIQAELDFNKSTLSRILSVLRNNQFLSKNSSARYELGGNLFLLGHAVNREHLLTNTARPIMQELSRELGFTCQMGIFEGNVVVVIVKAEPPTRLLMLSRVGSAVPAHCTALGKALLAFADPEQVESTINTHGLTRFTPNTICTANHLQHELADIRRKGYAISNSEHEKHLLCISVPLLGRDEELVAAISVTGTVVDFPDEESALRILPRLENTRDRIRAAMGFMEPGLIDQSGQSHAG